MSRSWISFEEQLTAVENLIRRCHNVGNLSDRSQDVHINTQMLNGWRMSEWKVAAAAAKIHSSRKPTQVHTPGTATGSWHALACTWHSSLQADVNPGHRWLHQSEQTFFHLISVFWKCRCPPRGSLPGQGRGRKPEALHRGCWVWPRCRRFLKRSPNYWRFPPFKQHIHRTYLTFTSPPVTCGLTCHVSLMRVARV